MADTLNHCLADWARLGVMYDCRPARRTPDVERLLVQTAGLLPGFARLLPTTVTWLTQFESLVCRHRLAHLAQHCSDPARSAALGLTLAFAQQHTRTSHLNVAIAACQKLAPGQPLFDVDRRSPSLARLSRDQACDLSKEWGLWTPQPELKPDAQRPADWLMARNPGLHYRAVFAGNLRASILATLAADPEAGQSETALATTCSVTRKALREALDHLTFCRLIERQPEGAAMRVMLTKAANAA